MAAGDAAVTPDRVVDLAAREKALLKVFISVIEVVRDCLVRFRNLRDIRRQLLIITFLRALSCLVMVDL